MIQTDACEDIETTIIETTTSEWLDAGTQYVNPQLDPQVAVQVAPSVQTAAVQTLPIEEVRSFLSAVERWNILFWRARRLSKLRKLKVQITDYLHFFDDLYIRTSTSSTFSA